MSNLRQMAETLTQKEGEPVVVKPALALARGLCNEHPSNPRVFMPF